MKDFDTQEARNIVAKNLTYYLDLYSKTQADIVRDCGINQSTLSDYFTAKKYPRPDKMQILADYFGIKKSDLTEKKGPSAAAESSYINEIIQLLSSLPAEEQELWYRRLKAMIEADGKSSLQ